MQPNNPIVGGAALRYPAIQSPNFVKGVSGWQINQDGTATFADVDIVGGVITLTDSAGNIVGTLDGTGGLVLYGAGDASDPGMTLTPDGDLDWGGVAAPATGPSVSVGSIFDASSNTHSALILSSGSTDASQTAAVMAVYAPDSADDQPGGVALLNGFFNASDPSVAGNQPTPEVWHTLALLNSWAAGSSAGYFHGLQYYIDGTGVVHLDGNIVAPGASVTATIATLPTKYRPSTNKIFINVYTANTPKVADFVISSSGNISMSGELGTGVSGTAFISASWPTM
jgi:hypothetical protein